MSSFGILNLGWMVFGLLVPIVQLIAAVILLRDRGVGPWLMLVGASISLLSTIASTFGIYFLARNLPPSGLPAIYYIIGGISGLGGILFAAGLLLFALQRRALHGRIAELEHIADPGR